LSEPFLKISWLFRLLSHGQIPQKDSLLPLG
jgi:hypothetical protein